jgi:S1-C subfamily serine protease
VKKKLLMLTVLVLIAAIGCALCACSNASEPSQTTSVDFGQVYALAEEAGYSGTMEELQALFKGDSAYALAQAAGYEGSEEEWLASLVGAAGKDGATPTIGANGNWYVDGVDTGVRAQAQDGVSIVGVEKTGAEGNVDKYVITFSNGTTFDFDVTNGLSAYEIAVKNGYEGTEKEWVASLKGVDGKDGINGTDGTDGKDGKDGIDGKDGADGKDGTNGKDAAYSINDIFTAYKEAYKEENGTEYAGPLMDFLQQYLPDTYMGTSTEAMVADAMLSCVSVYSTFNVTPYQDSTTNTLKNTITGAGAGVIYQLDKESGSAYILTNYHVVFNTSSTPKISEDITVFLYGYERAGVKNEQGTYDPKYPITAHYVGGSMKLDVALLYVENSQVLKTSDAKAAKIGDSAALSIGQEAIAIGNPEAEGLAVTSGVVSVDSENNRMAAADNSALVDFRVIRIDTAINDGNSGGGLFDSFGNLIGIVHAKMNSSAAENIAYAVPVNIAKYTADALIERFETAGKTGQYAATKCLLGIMVTRSDCISYYDSQTKRVRILETVIVDSVSEGAAAYGKLQAGDIIKSITVGDKPTLETTRTFVLVDSMLQARVGDIITIELVRDGQPMTVEIEVNSTTEIDKIG